MNSASSARMPIIFFGHGSPMNTLASNPYTEAWRKLGAAVPMPRAILAISAHWFTRGTAVTAMSRPRTIHDFGGFPQALFDFEQFGADARLSVPTPEHYLPLLYVAALQAEDETMAFAVDGYEAGSLGMLSAAAGMPAPEGRPRQYGIIMS